MEIDMKEMKKNSSPTGLEIAVIGIDRVKDFLASCLAPFFLIGSDLFLTKLSFRRFFLQKPGKAHYT